MILQERRVFTSIIARNARPGYDAVCSSHTLVNFRCTSRPTVSVYLLKLSVKMHIMNKQAKMIRFGAWTINSTNMVSRVGQRHWSRRFFQSKKSLSQAWLIWLQKSLHATSLIRLSVESDRFQNIMRHAGKKLSKTRARCTKVSFDVTFLQNHLRSWTIALTLQCSSVNWGL